jgi:ABC-type sugar transport system permease subunit
MSRKYLGSAVVASLVFLSPALLILIVFRVIPIGQAFQLSVTRWSGAGEPEWIGLGNFEKLLADPVFWTALQNNLLVLVFLPLWVVAPLVIAAIIHAGVPGAKFFRLMVFLPAVLSPVVIGAYFNVLLKYNGALNTFLRDIGLGALSQQWLTTPSTVLVTMVLIFIWATLGIGAVIFLAALAQVNPELYDAAELDGASWPRRLLDVTIPETRRTIEFWAIFVIISTFTTVFPFVFTLTRGGPGYSTYLLDYYVYDSAFFSGSFGYASAVGIVLFIIVSAVCGFAFWLMRRDRNRA